MSLAACTDDATTDSPTLDDIARNAAIGLPNNVPIPTITASAPRSARPAASTSTTRSSRTSAQRPALRQLPRADRGLDASRPQLRTRSRRPTAADRRRPRARRDLPHQRRLELAERRRLDAAKRARRPTACCSRKGLIRVGLPIPAERGVRAGRGRRPVRLRQRRRAVAVPPAAADDQPQLPQHGDVGRPRDASPSADPTCARCTSISPTRRTARPRPRPGPRRSTHGAARGDRRLRDGAVHRPDRRQRRRRACSTRPARRAARDALVDQPFYIGINDAARRLTVTRRRAFNPHARSRSTTPGRRYDAGQPIGSSTGRAAPSRAARRCSTRKPITITGVRASTTTSASRSSRAPARPATTRRTPATTRCRRRSTSASTDALAPHAGHAALHAAQHVDAARPSRRPIPGRALVTGKWKDIGRFKGPILRGLAARAPYFHNGSAANLDDGRRLLRRALRPRLTEQEHDDLVAFLQSL